LNVASRILELAQQRVFHRESCVHVNECRRLWTEAGSDPVRLVFGCALRYQIPVKIFVYSRGAIERVPPHDVPHVMVSITSSDADQARIPPSPHCRALLRLSFADADAPTTAIPEQALFSRAHARAIWDLVEEHLPHIERFIVHCDAGMCRSPAVAAAIAKVLEGDDTAYFRRYRPNMRVYRTMLETYYDRTAEL